MQKKKELIRSFYHVKLRQTNMHNRKCLFVCVFSFIKSMGNVSVFYLNHGRTKTAKVMILVAPQHNNSTCSYCILLRNGTETVNQAIIHLMIACVFLVYLLH